MLNKVCVITVKVEKMDEAIDFYTKVLGFQVDQRYGEKIVSLEHEGLPIVLEEISTGKSNDQSVLFALYSDDLDGDIQHLEFHETKILFNHPEPCPPGRYTIIEDPSGNQIEIVEFSNKNK
ncbi:hypothetical protein CEY16_13195 [Halalkalibacillus sediminis]|uniref:VOC domain-containing protein n=1 Tax=Halalkalibacillus sediminis TaxID=2018042 RepID=A0A2I0QRR7_9BACI|nr:VOC family protein [Halalkalibacillus sediminis]PKR76770.1 hypothetical protein CEY16_13195 [Halalkalibacillus sediminis]